MTFWALPVLATPWIPAVWLELSPVLETSKDWSTSPLSASCSTSWFKPPSKSKPSFHQPSFQSSYHQPSFQSCAMAGEAANISTVSDNITANNILFLTFLTSYISLATPGGSLLPIDPTSGEASGYGEFVP